MKKVTRYVVELVGIVCIAFVGLIIVDAQNVKSWSVTMDVGESISQLVSVSNKYTRAGNYRTNTNSSVMYMSVTKLTGGNAGTASISTLPTFLRKWVWTGWGSLGAGNYDFSYEIASGGTFVGSIQATDSEAIFN